ncbi:unnamed protein product [Polarella glacialis]|uniref:Uncharacterized protein n=2 Tax=Polarella glacialis TaxID=89957 RepID=A0A813HKY9_POLGL|nr:unnamed protein product [Polarella glacialis]
MEGMHPLLIQCTPDCQQKASLDVQREQVFRELRIDTKGPSLREVSSKNGRLSLELGWALSELEDNKALNDAWRVEAHHWRKEVLRLRAVVEEQERRGTEAANVLSKQIQEEDLALSRANLLCAEFLTEQARHDAAVDEAERQNATLKLRLGQNAALGQGGGTAQLFVAALPALDAADIEVARQAVEPHLHPSGGLSG